MTAAREHDEAAHELSLYPDAHVSDGSGRVDQMLVATPWHRHWDTSGDQQRAAAAHRSEAQALYAAYEEACGQRTANEVATSPIVKYGVGGNPTTDGVVLYLSPEAGPAERLMADLKCHRAWMRLAPANMEKCPLDLAGLQVDVKGSNDGITLTLTILDRNLIPELQRRAAADLEVGSGHKHHH